MAAAAAAAVLAGCAPPKGTARVAVRLAGAHVAVELMDDWLARAEHVRFAPERVQLYLSQHGFENLRAGTCDIACTDRPITVRELRDFGNQVISGHRVGFYGYALYVHPSNPLDSVYAGHIRLIFQGKVTSWKELGGPDVPIRLIGPRKSTRGGEILVRQTNIVVADAPWEVMETDTQIVDAVAADPAALGFASVGFDQNCRVLGIRMQRRSEPAFPSLEEIESEHYGLAKVLYVYVREPQTPEVQAVLDYLYSPAGQEAIEATDVWPIPRARGSAKPIP